MTGQIGEALVDFALTALGPIHVLGFGVGLDLGVRFALAHPEEARKLADRAILEFASTEADAASAVAEFRAAIVPVLDAG